MNNLIKELEDDVVVKDNLWNIWSDLNDAVSDLQIAKLCYGDQVGIYMFAGVEDE